MVESTTIQLGADDPEMVLGIVWRPGKDTLGFQVKLDDIVYTRGGGVSALPISGCGRGERFGATHICRCVRGGLCSILLRSRDLQRPTGLDPPVKSATKLAPLKTVSVCKLELNAALMGARLARFVQGALRRRFDARFFWTDSSTVRSWVRGTSSHYQVYVSHRIGEIQTMTEPGEWRYVPGRYNPADAATRSQLEEESIPPCWINGPEFLYDKEENWPIDLPWTVAKEELRAAHVHLSVTEPAFDWTAIKITARDLPALIRLKAPYDELMKRCQQESYHCELDRLKRKKPIRPTSALLQLTPILDEKGVLRLGGRLGRAKLPYDILHPPILPGRQPFARGVIQAFHESMHHAGTDFVLAHVRQHFWVTSGREAVKRVRNSCVPCRHFRPKAAIQMMADVHRARLGARQPPFTFTSVDYFGPIDVTHGRGCAKRWGALFTSLVTRAVYVEVAISLTAGDFLLVLRRFVSVYRKPAHMFSDHGTNLTGAERLLREELDRLKGDGDLEVELRALGIEWFFQPAQTPHFGGSHESMVRSVKNALYAALDSEKAVLRNPSDEILRTILFEVAGLLNTRPLTYTSSDPDDFRPLPRMIF
ncbi:uncharacterized protein LOC123473776 [Daphnia magna]|uniref:uncharacterized protein LOC123473776 n=1 Tax=Daphnia magna TaxID=35525 RepID=UPI001E1BAA93|nr:uncharacterized protein LOC123473776 [Daphnia magna]